MAVLNTVTAWVATMASSQPPLIALGNRGLGLLGDQAGEQPVNQTDPQSKGDTPQNNRDMLSGR